MAQQIVEMSKKAPFGLKRPSVEDVAALEVKKPREGPAHKLWSHETRMFDEKTVYLNKSTTKYVIIGIEPEKFEPTIKICDRTTGSHITISTEEKISKFRALVKKFVSGQEIDDELERVTGISIGSTFMGPNVCKLMQADGRGTIVMHKSSLQCFAGYDDCIGDDVEDRTSRGTAIILCLKYLKSYMEPAMTKAQKHKAILERMKVARDHISGTAYLVTYGIITLRPYLETLDEYKIFYE